MAAVPTAAKLIFLLFFFYLAVNLVQSSNIKPQVPAEDEEKLYVLALQWGISFCRDQSRVVCRQPVLQNFTIHGLWLYGQEYTGNILPPYTARMDLFRYRSGVDSIPEIHENWPSLLAGVSDFEFWSQQWWKHGRALGIEPWQYFQIAMGLKNQIQEQLGRSLTQFFKDKDLPPNEAERYDPRSFLTHIMIKMGVVTQMQCNINRESVYQLSEIRFCFDEQFLSTDCPTSKNHKYAQKVKRTPPHQYPTFHIGKCSGKGRILFPPSIPSSPPPPPPRQTPPPPRNSKSPPLKPKRRRRPPPPPLPKPMTSPLPNINYPPVTTFLEMLLKGTQSPSLPLPSPPSPIPLFPLALSFAEVVRQRPTPTLPVPYKSPPPPPPPPPPLRSPPPPTRNGSHVRSFAEVVGLPAVGRATSATSSTTKQKKNLGGRAWGHFGKLILTLSKFVMHIVVLGALRKLKGNGKSSRKKNVRWTTFIYFFHSLGFLKMKKA